MKSKICVFIAVLTLAVVSCHENDIMWNTENLEFRTWEFAAPVAKVHVPLYQTMIKEEMDFDLFVNDAGIVCIRYTQSETVEWSDEIGIDDFSASGTTAWKYDLGNQIPAPGSFTLHPVIYPINLTTSDKATGSYVDEADLSAGTLTLSVSVPAGFTSYTITITIPELTTDGVEFSQEFTPGNTTFSISLAGCKIQTTTRQLNMKCEITVNTGSSVSGELEFTFSLSDMEVSYMAGYFGELSYEEEEGEMEFNFFYEFDFEGAIVIKDIRLDAVVTNKAGIPLKVDAEFSFANESGFEKPLELSKPFSFSIPGATESGANHTVTSVEEKYATTAPVIEFENQQEYPTKLKYVVNGKGNYEGNPNIRNFVVKTDDGVLSNADITLTVPLHLKVEAYNRTDPVDFDYNKLVGNNEDIVNTVEYVMVHLEIDNGLPFDITLEAFAINTPETYKALLRDKMEIAAKTYKQSFEILLTDDQLEKFRTNDVKKIILHTKAKTQNANYVEVREDDILDISVKVQVKADIPSNIFD